MEKSIEHIRLGEAYNDLQIQLEEANDIINAIRSGEVDALVVNGKEGHQLFTLKSADHSYRIFIEQMTESAITLDESGKILYCNSQFAKLISLPMEKIIGLDFLDFVVKDYRNFATEVIEAAWDVDTKTELELKDSAGNTISVQLSLKALTLDDGVTLSLIITDLSDLKKNQLLLQTRNDQLEEARTIADALNENLENIVKQRTLELEAKNQELAKVNQLQAEINNQLSIALSDLKESEDNLHSAFNAGELGSASLDLKTGKAEMSEKFRLLYGLPLDDEINWNMILDAVDPDYVPELNQVLENCVTKGMPVDSTYPIYHLASGERRWMRVVGKVKKDSAGNFDSVYAVLMDVTDQKQDEQRKNDFIAMVSHELKTPLTSMKGYIQVMQLKSNVDNNSFSKKALDGAERQISKMANMINGFLNISRLESGKILMNIERVNINDLLHEVIEEHATTVTTHHITSTCGAEIFINADKEKLQHVISNLIGNAVKYSPINSNVLINCFKDGGNAIFSVTDDGIGISKNDLPRLFERFYRVESAQTATVSGFGIGLYLSAEIIKRSGGKIWAESEPGKGSVFYFSLPLAAEN